MEYNLFVREKNGEEERENCTHSAIAEGAISSRFSMLHSSKNSRIGEGWEPTEI